MVTRCALTALWCFIVMTARGQEPRPSFTFREGMVAAVFPSSVLENKSVKKQLSSGLTTTFLIVARERSAVSGARLEVRYDLWDEVWIVRRVEFDGKVERQRLASTEAMEKWWRTPVRLLATSAARVALQVEMSVLPFSAAEQEDARQWIVKPAAGAAAGGTGGIVDALIGTTISARPITSYKWQVDLALR